MFKVKSVNSFIFQSSPVDHIGVFARFILAPEPKFDNPILDYCSDWFNNDFKTQYFFVLDKFYILT